MPRPCLATLWLRHSGQTRRLDTTTDPRSRPVKWCKSASSCCCCLGGCRLREIGLRKSFVEGQNGGCEVSTSDDPFREPGRRQRGGARPAGCGFCSPCFFDHGGTGPRRDLPACVGRPCRPGQHSSGISSWSGATPPSNHPGEHPCIIWCRDYRPLSPDVFPNTFAANRWLQLIIWACIAQTICIRSHSTVYR